MNPRKIEYPTQKELKRLFDYKDGKLIKRIAIPRSKTKIGVEAGGCNGRGYRHVRVNGVLFKAHRLIWIYIYGSIDPKLQIDHINRVRDDNRIENLRLATSQINNFNTECKGYCWCKTTQKWLARITKDYKQIHLGYYDTEEDARKVYLEAKNKYHKIKTCR